MKKLFLILTIALVALACKTKQHASISVSEVTDTERIEQTITPVVLPADSASIRAVLECDSNYNVVLKELINLKSQNIEASFNWSGGVLDYQVVTGGYTVYSFKHYYTRYRNNIIKYRHYITKTIKVDKLALKYKALIFVLAGLVVALMLIIFRSKVNYILLFIRKLFGS